MAASDTRDAAREGAIQNNGRPVKRRRIVNVENTRDRVEPTLEATQVDDAESGDDGDDDDEYQGGDNFGGVNDLNIQQEGQKLARFALNYEAGGRVLKRKDIIHELGYPSRLSSKQFEQILHHCNSALKPFGLRLQELANVSQAPATASSTKELILSSTVSRDVKKALSFCVPQHFSYHIFEHVLLFIILGGTKGLLDKHLTSFMLSAKLIEDNADSLSHFESNLARLVGQRYIRAEKSTDSNGASQSTYFLGARAYIEIDVPLWKLNMLSIIHPTVRDVAELRELHQEDRNTLDELFDKVGLTAVQQP